MEIWKDIKGFEGIYKISDLGNIKSLSRYDHYINGKSRFRKELILKQRKDNTGYFRVCLTKDKKQKVFHVHHLMAISFLNHSTDNRKIVIDHINNNRSDNKLDNLQIISNRENTSKDRSGYSSNYVGVSWYKKSKKWRANIHYNNKQNHLGFFDTELEASNANQQKLKEIT